MTDPTWETLRSRDWDVPSDSLSVLLGMLGQHGRPLAEQQQALRDWLGSASAHAAPAKLTAAVRKFLEVPAGE